MPAIAILGARILQGGGDDGGLFGALFSGVSCVCWGAIYILAVIGLWKMFVKAGHPGWAAIIPIYNIYILMKIVGRPGWWVILWFIPFVNFVIAIIVSIDLAKSFGKSAAWGIILLFIFSIIGFLILGFGDAKYQGSAASTAVTPTA
jgi:hypothetical protein